MPRRSGLLANFWQELKRRKVIYVVSVYASASFVLIELVNNVTEPLKLPESLPTIVIITLAIGFPVAVILSWIYDLTNKGFKKTGPLEEAEDGELTDASPSWKIATYVSLFVIIALVIFNVVTIRSHAGVSEDYEKSIAVLPFMNDSPDADNGYFINGTMEAILDHLCKIEDLRVVSRTSVEQYRNALKPIPEVAREMNVSYVLEGSMQKYGNQIRLNLQLIDASDRHLWSRPYDREILQMEDLLSLQSEIASLVAGEIRATITPEEKGLIEKKATRSLTAYDFYQRGLEELNRFNRSSGNVEVLIRAKNYFQLAIGEDPAFAKAYSGLASIYWETNFWPEYFAENSLDSVRILADLALTHDPQLAEAFSLKGRYFRHHGRSSLAEEALSMAIKLNPNDWEAYLEMGNVAEDYAIKIESFHQAAIRCRDANLSYILLNLWRSYLEMGFVDQARQYMKEDLQLNQDSAYYHASLCWFNYLTGDFKESAGHLDQAIRLNPAYARLLGYHEIYINAGQVEKAYETYKMLEESSEGSSEIQIDNTHRIAYAYWMTGHREEAGVYFTRQIRYGEESIRLNREFARSKMAHYNLAAVYAFKGEMEKAYEYLEEVESLSNVPFYWLTNMKADRLFENLRGEERYEQFLRSMESKYLAEHNRISKVLETKGLL